ncbi:MAG TPA: hypothetical protein VFD05_02590 [Bacilli bacterium]|nr:hypothetical protein [Bacilli bacterium]
MVLTILELKEKYKDYADINGKIKREVDNNILFPIVRGLYETNKNVSGYLLAAFIYGPSYLSFEYALAFHNLIPERVAVYTNATFGKRKSKQYENMFGNYIYRDVPDAAFPYFVEAHTLDTYVYFMATAEKALCDLLYISPPVKSVKALEMLLFDNLRIERDEFTNLNFKHLAFLSSKYISNNINYLMKLIERIAES